MYITHDAYGNSILLSSLQIIVVDYCKVRVRSLYITPACLASVSVTAGDAGKSSVQHGEVESWVGGFWEGEGG